MRAPDQAQGSIEKLKELLGHSSVVVTEKYASGPITEQDLSRVDVDLRAGGKLVRMRRR